MYLNTIFSGLKIFTISNQAPYRVAIEISLSANEMSTLRKVDWILWDSTIPLYLTHLVLAVSENALFVSICKTFDFVLTILL